MAKRLTREFYAADTIELARQLLGQTLVHRLENGIRLSGKIVETEAYLGHEDPAAHSYGGRRTPRTEVMYAPAGTSYIYFIYGMYFCFNVVASAADDPQAVLIRALEPLEGANHMRTRKTGVPLMHYANGPGKLCYAMQLDRTHNGLDLITSKRLWIEDGGATSDVDIVEGPRVGLGDRHDAVHWPLRFGFAGHPALSRPPFP